MYALFISELASVWIEIFGAICVLSIGWLWGRWRSGVAWKQKRFTNRVVLSLNSLTYQEVESEGKTTKKPVLQLRTIFERDAIYVFQNEIMAEILNKCIKKVEPSDCLVHFAKEDSWYMLNAILNQICERFADGLLKKDMGMPIETRWYTFCMTYELEGSIRTHKPRVMMMEKEAFDNFPDDDPKNFVLEAETHTTRVKTLQHLKKQRQKYPHLFMDIQLSF